MATINTRIQLKYDTLANWNASTFLLKKGELAIVEVPTVEGSTLQPVMFKVGTGDKKFSELDWASAKAADVYGWAKKAKLDLSDLPVEAIDTNTDTQYSFEIPTVGDNKGKLVVKKALYNKGVKGTEEIVGAYDFVTPEELTEVLKDYYTKEEIDGLFEEFETKIPTSEDFGVLSVTGEKAIEVDNTAVQKPIVKLLVQDSDSITLSQDDKGLKAEIIDSKVEEIATSTIETLLKNAGVDKDATVANIVELVNYVNDNASDIAQLVTDVATANTNASNAVTTANGASETAGQALTKAEEALEGAEGAAASASAAATAQSKAEAAQAAAEAAKGAAVAAQGNAETAKADAESAKGAAITAKEAAEEARHGAEVAQTEAETNAGLAQGYASAASTSAGEAASSASAASTSASQASTSAGQASTKAGEAAGSATAAAGSAGAAATAQGKAEEAQAKAEAAKAAAEQAKSDADGILTQVTDTATGAQTTANSALEAANSAVNVANTAKEAADAATEAVEGLHSIATSGTIYDLNEVETSVKESGVKYLVFDCGSALTLID